MSNEATAPSGRSLRGKRLGPYALVEHLASGGMAEIFLARHEAEGEFRKDLVLKVLAARYAEMPEVVEMFLTEARLGAMLNHPNIVDVYDVGADEGLRYIAMEHIPGWTMTDVVRRGIEVSLPLPLDIAVYIVAETAAGMAYMHDGLGPGGRPLGIVHRDISPSNLIIGVSGQTKVIDFGIARAGQGADAEGARPGKVSYMSPEQVQGRPLDGRSDIFSLGTILYEVTLGKRLWRGPREQVMQRIVDEKAPPPTYVKRDYPAALELIVMRALEKRPEDRYQTAGELFQDLEGFLVGAGARTRNHHVAQYVHDLFAPEAEVSEVGVRRARAFVDDEAVDEDELDFDRPAPKSGPKPGAGKALADALRSTGPYMAVPPAAAAAPAPPQPAAKPVSTPAASAPRSAAAAAAPRRVSPLLVALILAVAAALVVVLARR
jgi:serine/threonine-protein kinase